MSKEMLWLFDLDDTLYGPTAPYREVVVRRMELSVYSRGLCAPGKYEERGGELRRIWKTDDTTLAFALEHGIDFDELMSDVYDGIAMTNIPIRLRPGVEAIKHLPGVKGVFSNAPHRRIRDILQHFNISALFNVIHGVAPNARVGKPHDEAYVLASNGFEEIAMVEDREENLLPAVRRGWHCFHLPAAGATPSRDPRIHVIDSFSDLLRFV